MTMELPQGAAATGAKQISRPMPRARWVVPAIFILFALAMAVLSRGFMEADEISHFLYARSAWGNWRLIVSIWGRLGCTAFFAPAAPFGLTAARVLAVSVTALVGWGTVKLLRVFLPAESLAPQTWVRRHADALVWV